jgi:hypothetical protein
MAKARTKARGLICQWCSKEMLTETTCSNCQASYNPALAEAAIPGLTEISKELREYAAKPFNPKRAGLLGRLFHNGQSANPSAL